MGCGHFYAYLLRPVVACEFKNSFCDVINWLTAENYCFILMIE